MVRQIVSQIERLRDSGKQKLKVTLGEGDSELSVDISITSEGVKTVFEGNHSMLKDLKEQWDDISKEARKKGVQLKEPEYISYSLPSESVSFFSADGDLKEDESKSVIQHKDNQPVRPVEQTAAAGSSSPVHSHA